MPRLEIYIPTDPEKEEINQVARKKGYRGSSAYLVNLHREELKRDKDQGK